MKKALMMVAAVAVSMAMAPAEEKLGKGVSLKDATPIADVMKNPEAFVGKTIRIDGTATAVCEMMGCWLAVSESDKAGAPTIRLKVDHGTIKFPTSAKGKQVSAEGTFEKIAADDHESKNAAAEHAKHQAAHPAPAASAGHAAHGAAQAGAKHEEKHPGLEGFQLKATGAIIK